MQEFLAQELENIKAAGLYKNERIITTPQSADIKVNAGQGVLNFCANNYLGLADNKRLIEAAKAAMDSHGLSDFLLSPILVAPAQGQRQPGICQRIGLFFCHRRHQWAKQKPGGLNRTQANIRLFPGEFPGGGGSVIAQAKSAVPGNVQDQLSCREFDFLAFQLQKATAHSHIVKYGKAGSRCDGKLLRPVGKQPAKVYLRTGKVNGKVLSQRQTPGGKHIPNAFRIQSMALNDLTLIFGCQDIA